ncbi:CGGC domain-containing protein [Dehalobacter sp. DCM]|uniref:CGGC domain-containing protein n=1 Tax=Dehalobacter sp. DCM TaxID=2907827 RepID=UPI003081A3D4|nr:CGGC domain-containing protein [Dehalobacter sp. DCM]
MEKIGLFCCSKSTRENRCASAQCLNNINNRTGDFQEYSDEKEIDLVGIINCPGCPSEIPPDRLSSQIKSLAELQVNKIYFSNCMNSCCVFRYDYQAIIERDYPDIDVFIGTDKELKGNSSEWIITRRVIRFD